MLHKVNKALLLSDVPSFAENYKTLASDIGVSLSVEKEWNSRYRITAEVVVFGTKYFNDVNRAYFPQSVLILKKGESPAPYIKEGISRFIFDYQNTYELLCALYKLDKVIIHASSNDLKTIIKDSDVLTFQFGEYDFMFDKNKFKYKGKPIYLADSQKRYLAEWLLNGHKDNKKRMILCNLRKKLGEDFLKDVDRFGQIKEEK